MLIAMLIWQTHLKNKSFPAHFTPLRRARFVIVGQAENLAILFFISIHSEVYQMAIVEKGTFVNTLKLTRCFVHPHFGNVTVKLCIQQNTIDVPTSTVDKNMMENTED